MENRRGRRLNALVLTGCIATPVFASCPITPQERNLDYRIVQDRRAVELRRYGTPDSAAPICVVQLGCRLSGAKPTSVSYTLRAGSILLGDFVSMQFFYSDGTSHACRVTDIQVPP